MRAIFCSALTLSLFSANALAASASIDSAKLAEINALRVGGTIVIDRFPDGYGGQSTLHFTRVDPYAHGARVIVVDASGEREIARSKRIELIGVSAAGDVRVSLALDPAGTRLAGVGTTRSGTYVVSAERSKSALRLRAVPVESTYPAGVVPRVLGNDDSVPSGRPMPSDLEASLASAPTGGFRYALVAVDTDTEFMSERFSNNTSAAADWIADLFTTMNVMYQRDLDVNLEEGTTILRTTTDPYQQNDTPADQNDLTEFGTYWQNHYASTPRSFAILLSGKSSSGNSASGIAWINAYCETQSSGGSYSVNQIFTNPGIDVSLSARIVGHELGHNFGAYHTHCTNITNGSAPTGTNTIDQCYNGEAASGCYAGAQSCPSSGPGSPAGTIMSYCNIGGSSGGCGQNVLQFHPTQVNVLDTLIAQHTPSCLVTVADDIFRNGFEP